MWSLPPKSTALVTGGTKGIGHAIVTELAGVFGCKVVTCARDEKSLQACIKEWSEAGLDVRGVAGDVSTIEGREDVMRKVEEMIEEEDSATGKLDILVNNVGTNIRKKTIDYSEEELEFILRTNLKSMFELTKLCNI